jgi:hypothetical protein
VPDLEVANVLDGEAKRPRRQALVSAALVAQREEFAVPGIGVDHPRPVCVKELADAEGAFVGREQFRRLHAELQMAVPRFLTSERLQLDEQRGNQVERDPHRGMVPQERHHAPVVFDGVHPDPRQHMLPRQQVLIEGLVHVPQNRNAGHNVIIACAFSIAM